MFTGIVQGTAAVAAIDDRAGLRTFTLEFPDGFCAGLEIGASVAVDGVCLTVTSLPDATSATFDVILQSLSVTTLGDCVVGSRVNVERAARDGAEIGGHPLSGHIDFSARIAEVRSSEHNRALRIEVAPEWRKYIFAKGYIAINGCSLTISEADRAAGWFEVWLIPETRRMTTFEQKRAGDLLNIEIERSTQVVVDTVRDTVTESLGALLPALEALLAQQGKGLEDLLVPAALPATEKRIQKEGDKPSR